MKPGLNYAPSRESLSVYAIVVYAALCVFLFVSPSLAQVYVSEIHLQPLEGELLQYVKLTNRSLKPVSLQHWQLRGSVDFLFRDSTSIPARSSILVARSVRALVEHFSLNPQSVVGEIGASLNMPTLQFRLLSPTGAVIDRVQLKTRNGTLSTSRRRGETTVVRANPRAAGDAAAAWKLASLPDPHEQYARAEKFAISSVSSPVVITEIQYHPAGDRDEDFEFIELYNRSQQPYDLQGCKTEGVDFEFSKQTILQPGDALSIARNKDALSSFFPKARIVGSFKGQLANSGERISLNCPAGTKDSVRYADTGLWQRHCDGSGGSLQRYSPDYASDDPMNWHCGAQQKARLRKIVLAPTFQPKQVLLYLQGEGTVEVQHFQVSCEECSDPIYATGFDTDIGSFAAGGNHIDSRWAPRNHFDPRGAMQVKSYGPGASRNGNNVALDLDQVIKKPVEGRLTIEVIYRFIDRRAPFKVKIFDAKQEQELAIVKFPDPLGSPGVFKPQTLKYPPPLIHPPLRSPAQPKADEHVWISALIESQEPVSATIVTDPGTLQERRFKMFDDGAHGDREAGDSIFGALLPPALDTKIVQYRIEAKTNSGAFASFPRSNGLWESAGYATYQQDHEATIPTLHIEIPGISTEEDNPLSALECDRQIAASLAWKGSVLSAVRIHRRGKFDCGDAVKKPSLHVKIAEGGQFFGRQSFNLNGMGGDPSMLREFFSSAVLRKLGYPNFDVEFVRLSVNGEYYGLYLLSGHPSKREIGLQGLPRPAALYKSYGPASVEKDCRYLKGDDSRTCDDIRDFLQKLHDTPSSELHSFFQSNVDVNSLIDYQIAQVILDNHDYIGRNYFFYRPEESDAWQLLPWDLDYTFVTPGVPLEKTKQSNPDQLLAVTPWSGTRLGKQTFAAPHRVNHLIDKFLVGVPNDYYVRAFLVQLWISLVDQVDPSYFKVLLDGLKNRIEWEYQRDVEVFGDETTSVPEGVSPFDYWSSYLLANLQYRRQLLLRFLWELEGISTVGRLIVSEIFYNPPGIDRGKEFIELVNPLSEPVDVGGWSLNDSFQFSANTVIEPGEIIVVTDNVESMRSTVTCRVFGPLAKPLPNDGSRIILSDSGPGHPAIIDRVTYGTHFPWPIAADGYGASLEIRSSPFLGANELPASWTASRQGGTPCQIR